MSEKVIAQLSIPERVVAWMDEHLGAKQLCWVCLAVTAAAVYYFTANYARASDVTRVDDKVKDVQLQQLQRDLIDLRLRQCKDASGQKQWYAERVAELERSYIRLDEQHRVFDLPQCADL